MQRGIKRVQKKSLTQLRRLAKLAASQVEILDKAENRDQEAINLAAKELAMYAAAIEYKIAVKKNKKFAY